MTNNNQTNNHSDVLKDDNYAEELGTIVFQSALMQYLVSENEEQATAFNAFIETHVATDSFLEDLCNEYPDFEKLLQQEMLLLQKEIAEIVPE